MFAAGIANLHAEVGNTGVSTGSRGVILAQDIAGMVAAMTKAENARAE